MSNIEFINNIKKVKSSRVHKIKNSHTIYNIYLYYRKKYKHSKQKSDLVSANIYYKIIRMFNKEIRELMLKGFTITLPHQMGDLSIRKYETSVEIVDDKVKVTYPISWKETLDLWSTEPEEYKKRTLLRSSVPEVYRVIYNKKPATYGNKLFYLFTVNREFKTLMKNKINSDELETFNSKKYEWANN